MSQNPYQSPGIPRAVPRRMVCQNCGVEAPTRYVEFHQNIGALVMRFHKSICGNFCKSCIHKRFWEYTAINCLLGWWGMISLIVTPFFILNNVGRYLLCLTMPRVPPQAPSSTLTPDTVARLKPYTALIADRLNAGEKMETLVHDLAGKTGVMPGQVFRYIQALIEGSRRSTTG